MKIAIDCRELTRKKIVSVGHCLTNLMSYWKESIAYQLSDIPLPDRYRLPGCENLCFGRICRGKADLILYQQWMKRALEARRPDILFQINHYAIVPIRGVKTVTVIHDLYAIEGLEHFNAIYQAMFRIFIRRTLRYSARTIAISAYTQSRIKALFGEQNHVQVVYNGVDNIPTDWSPGDTPLISGRYLLVLGRLNHWKGTERLLALYRKYLTQSGYKLVFAGLAENESIRQSMLKACAEEPSIRWLDYVTNRERENLYRNASLLLYASRFDGFGSPPLEAALRGTKCLMNDIPVLREVTHGIGYYVDYYGDGATVAAAILQTLNKPDSAKDAALLTLARSYTWKACAETLMTVFGDVLS